MTIDGSGHNEAAVMPILLTVSAAAKQKGRDRLLILDSAFPQLNKMARLGNTEVLESLLFSCLLAVLAFVAGTKKEEIPDYLPKIFSTQTLPITFSKQNVSLAEEYAKQGCPTLPSSVQIFSIDPLVIYIRNFTSPAENDYIKEIALVFANL